MGLGACNYFIHHNFRHDYKDANELLHSEVSNKLFMKAHMKNGDVFIFSDNWKISDDQSSISGFAKHYDFNRYLISENKCTVFLDSVAIFETNNPIDNKDGKRIIALSILTAVDLPLGVYCIFNPKACFGSCPTFYYGRQDNVNYANAEGFSSSICPSLEDGDLDALNNGKITGGEFVLTMKNEAMENHAVNEVKIFALPRNEGQRIFNNSDGKYFACSKLTAPSLAKVNDQVISSRLENIDNLEYFSLTDSNDLTKKETINLTFNNPGTIGNSGLVLNFRQTLLTTFLLYSVYGYMGDEVGDITAKIETDKDFRKYIQKPINLLGGIDVWVFNETRQEWQFTESIFEAGPIAKNLQLVNLPTEVARQSKINVQIRMTRGYWRLDYTALASIDSMVVPLELTPYKVTNKNITDTNAFNNVTANDNKYLTTVPGDSYQLHFRLPVENNDYELFVYSKGYYLEWIRKSWLSQKNLPKLMGMVSNDTAVWHSLAKEFKNVEWDMETTFWSSKYHNN